jgi:prevent-host-death family protein
MVAESKEWSHNVVMSPSKPRTIGAAEFKARCLSILDRVQRTREPVLVTKHGRPVAYVVPAPSAATASLKGSVKVHGDLLAPTGENWEVDE